MKLERLLKKWGQWGRKEVRAQLAAEKVRVNGLVISDASFQIGKFDLVEWGRQVVQDRTARYLMMNKPLGVVSATTDDKHVTVVDLVVEDWARELHLAGRLDRFTSGLLILTNDSGLSEMLTEPRRKQGKVYRVECDKVITNEMVASFEAGVWMAREKMMTQPARVKRLGEKNCLLTIYEGKHHQVKRMFARFGVKVLSLHREAMGSLTLDSNLRPGEWRALTDSEVRRVIMPVEKTGEVGL